jgi:LysM repeat protein
MSHRATTTLTRLITAENPSRMRLRVERNWELVTVLVFIGVVLIALFTALVAYANTAEPASVAAAPASAPAAQAPAPRTGVVPTPAPAATPSPAGQAPERTYQVRAGDTLASVALRHGVDYRRIAADNQLTDVNLIHPGQRLRIGQPTAGVRLIRPGDTLSGLAEATGVPLARLLALNPWISNPNRIPAGAGLRVGA